MYSYKSRAEGSVVNKLQCCHWRCSWES